MENGKSDAVRALIVDDNELVRVVTGQMVEHCGFTVAGFATDGLEAVELAQTCAPDVVIMDYDLPGLDGIAATKAIRAIKPIPVVLCTGSGGEELMELARDAGIVAVLSKPFAAHLLDHVIRSVCPQRRPSPTS